MFILKIITLIMVFLGCVSSPSIIWNLVDILVAILIIINTYAILKLKKDILEVTIVENKK